VDGWGYGEPTLVPWNFVRINVLERVGLEYGVHSWHWYFSQCLPAMLGAWLPAFLLGTWQVLLAPAAAAAPAGTRVLAELTLGGLAALSVSGHKELRFALPLLPAASVVTGLGLAQLPRRARSAYVAVAALAHMGVALYLGRWHQGGAVPLMDWLADQQQQAHFIDFYTRCHATPYWSHVHATQVRRMRFLDCSPAVSALLAVSGMDHKARTGTEEEDAFLASADHAVALALRIPTADREWPSHVVVASDVVRPEGRTWLRDQGYRECTSFRHTADVSFHAWSRNCTGG
jgi:phosphatidylinositol glycan class B